MRNTQGMTIVEVIVSVAILSIASMILFLGFVTATNFMQHGNEIKDQGELAYSAAEGEISGAAETSRQPAEFGFSAGGFNFNVPGDYIEAKDKGNGQKFTRFAPK